MGKKNIKKSKKRILLNAEPFGFGPTAAVATFFPYIRDSFEFVGYLGKSHTLDLQKDLPYDSIHDSTNLKNSDLEKVIKEYDIFFTALDFEMIGIAKKASVKTIIYDSLTWYWKSIPKLVRQSDLYIAQDFFGVKNRLVDEPNSFPKDTRIVPPIVSKKSPKISKKYTLLNMGGLQNPLLDAKDFENYAKLCIQVVEKCIDKDENLIIATSQAVASRLNHPRVKSYNRTDMCEILNNTKYAFMTPGLGNIYDTAIFNIPTVWLPPANDSQGQQVSILETKKLLDTKIDWSELGNKIDYFDTQDKVLEQIKNAINTTLDEELLGNLVKDTREQVKDKNDTPACELLNIFGIEGAEKVGRIVYDYCKEN